MRSTGASRYVPGGLTSPVTSHRASPPQNAFRQNIMQMQETARHSLMSFNTPGGSPRSSQMIPSEDSGAPMTHGANKSSALRYYVSDDGSQMDDRSDEDLMRKGDPNAGRF